MYIKLGNTRIKYGVSKNEKYMTIAEVVDSPLSYEEPIVVNSVAELNALFSKSFSDYYYLKSLLETYPDFGLYLYKPLSTEKCKVFLQENEDYINYRKDGKIVFKNIDPYDIFSPSKDYIEYYEEWKDTPDMCLEVFNNINNPKSTKYLRYNQGTWVEEKNPRCLFKGEPIQDIQKSKFEHLRDSKDIYVELEGVNWIYVDTFGFIPEEDLPQNQVGLKNSYDLDNRSTLFIPLEEKQEINYVYPEYVEGKGLMNFTYDNNKLEGKKLTGKINAEKLRAERETLALRISAKEIDRENKGILGFIDNSGEEKVYITITTEEITNNNRIFPETANNIIVEISESDNILDKIKEVLGNNVKDGGYGYDCFTENNDLVIFNRSFIDVGYNTFPGLNIRPDNEVTQAILYNYVTDYVGVEESKRKGVSFWSKTIGGTSRLDVEGPIKIQIEVSNKNIIGTEYLVFVTRYDYSESFSGYLTQIPGVDRLDVKISKESKLIRMEVPYGVAEIPTGNFEMSRGKYIDYFPRAYWMNSLKLMFDFDEDRISTDFLLIPNIDDYTPTLLSSNYTYHKEYETILSYCKKGNFQALIQNKRSYFDYIEVESKDDIGKNYKDFTIYRIKGNKEEQKIQESLSYGDTLVLERSNHVGSGTCSLTYSDGKFSSNIGDKTNIKTVLVKEENRKISLPIEIPNLTSLVIDNRKNISQVKICYSNPKNRDIVTLIIDAKKLEIVTYYSDEKVWKISTPKGIDPGYYLLRDGKLTKVLSKKTITTAVFGGDYPFNYLGDHENRLLYFYGTITDRNTGAKSPGYSIFLDGIMLGNYSGVADQIIYDSPVLDPYNKEPIEEYLEFFRSNYLVFNGQTYYYKKYLEPEDRTTSIFLRFVIGKLSREFYKLKSYFIGEKIIGKVKQRCTDLLKNLKNKFSIIEELRMTKFETNLTGDQLDIEVSTAVKNLVDKDIRLNITLNLIK